MSGEPAELSELGGDPSTDEVKLNPDAERMDDYIDAKPDRSARFRLFG